MSIKKVLLLLLIVAAVVSAQRIGVADYLSLESIKQNHQSITTFYIQHTALFILIYMATYVVITALSIPGAAAMTLIGGAIMGPWIGSIIIVLSATLGALCAMLIARFIIRDSIEQKYGTTIEKFNSGIQNNALNYILFLRLIPAFPFFLVNIGLGLTRIQIPTFVIGSLIGMIPGTFVYANAGSQLSQITSIKDIASPEVLGAFTLLGLLALLPILYRRFKRKR